MRPEIYEKEIKSKRLRDHELRCDFAAICEPAPTMGLAPGGQMRQQIYLDHFGFEAWDRSHSSRCFVHLCNSLVWQSITGQLPPYPPPTAKSYSKAGLPWFDHYRDDVEAAPGSSTLAELKSVSQTSQTKLDHAVPENEAFTLPPTQIRQRKTGPRNEMRQPSNRLPWDRRCPTPNIKVRNASFLSPTNPLPSAKLNVPTNEN
jgi:hypothetical protein